MSSRTSVLTAFLLSLPMAVLLVVMVFEITPVEIFFKSFLTNDGSKPNTFGLVYMIGSLIALPIGLVMSLLPMFKKDKKGKRHFYLVNAAIAALIIILMVPTWGGLLKDIYRCDILHIPNCD